MPRTPHLRALTVALVLATAATGCSSSGNSASGPSTTSTPSVSCPPLTAATPRTEESLVVGGQKRTYTVWPPTGYTGTKAVPLILNFHGTGGSPDAIEAFTQMAAKGNPRGYLVVAPQALVGDKGSSSGWTVPGFGTEPDDVTFTNALIDRLATRYCIDQKRVYATGFSSGGAFSTYLACADSPRFAGVAPGGGVSLVNPVSNAFCRRGPVPVYAFHGTADQFVPYRGLGGEPDPELPAKTAYIGDVQKTMAAIATVNGCTQTTIDTPLAADVTVREWTGCTADTRILIVKDGGHTFPGSTLSLGQEENRGDTTRNADMAALLLDWFATQHKP